jgi:hypothetical protein
MQLKAILAFDHDMHMRVGIPLDRLVYEVWTDAIRANTHIFLVCLRRSTVYLCRQLQQLGQQNKHYQYLAGRATDCRTMGIRNQVVQPYYGKAQKGGGETCVKADKRVHHDQIRKADTISCLTSLLLPVPTGFRFMTERQI